MLNWRAPPKLLTFAVMPSAAALPNVRKNCLRFAINPP
jgi:hypothetical protein